MSTTSGMASNARSRVPGFVLFLLMLVYGCAAIATAFGAGLSMFVVDSCGVATGRCASDAIGALLPLTLGYVAVVSLLVFVGVVVNLARGRRTIWIPLVGMVLLVVGLVAQNIALSLLVAPKG
ncbi:hypothetical protein CLV46_2965 [Diaminobutyricimonas aerilata]|uniref:Uncharacterized protein n=1 Tax=Diaminobutyricimonas aerilata TaxID=1162967 RepID=A0A2M9CNC9_9MICO|nr:hypothetical protein [Diaminobutyricimonas aerilata]PJJ73378.1 hypothetical protein CLV46_2965 [Diaminobutyricimonas aerilata]